MFLCVRLTRGQLWLILFSLTQTRDFKEEETSIKWCYFSHFFVGMFVDIFFINNLYGPSLSVDNIMSGEKILSCTGSLRVTDLGLLHVGDNYVAWSAYMTPSNGTRICSWCIIWLFGTNFLWQGAFLRLDAGVGACSFFKLICQTLLTHYGRTYSFWGVDGKDIEWKWGRKWEKRREGKLWLVYKINKKFKIK